MKRIIILFLFIGLVASMFLKVPQSHAILIQYQVTDLADTTVSEDLWQYTYTVSEHTFAADTGFTIYFDYTLYGAIEPFPIGLYQLLPPNTDWDVITLDPDPNLFDDGVYDALALVNDASLANPFTVSFVWLGIGTPGVQPFDLYTYNWTTDEVTVTASGNTSPIPEPATLMLLGTGIFGIFAAKRKTRKQKV